MCGRYTLTNPDPAGLRARFDILESAEVADPPRYNIAPTDPALAVRRLETGARELGRLRWGLVPGRWAEKASGRPLINARAETLRSQPAFRESFAARRCLIHTQSGSRQRSASRRTNARSDCTTIHESRL